MSDLHFCSKSDPGRLDRAYANAPSAQILQRHDNLASLPSIPPSLCLGLFPSSSQSAFLSLAQTRFSLACLSCTACLLPVRTALAAPICKSRAATFPNDQHRLAPQLTHPFIVLATYLVGNQPTARPLMPSLRPTRPSVVCASTRLERPL